jgi:hypothetical protein
MDRCFNVVAIAKWKAPERAWLSMCPMYCRALRNLVRAYRRHDIRALQILSERHGVTQEANVQTIKTRSQNFTRHAHL